MSGLANLQLFHRYHRQEIANFVGVNVNQYWQQGVVRADLDYMLFVTLDKTGRPPAIQYDDRFLSPTDFQWQSQNQETRAKRGAKYQNRGRLNFRFHLLVRRSSREADNTTAPFVYLGQVRFHSWDSDNPINIRWTLDNPVPQNLRSELKVPEA